VGVIDSGCDGSRLSLAMMQMCVCVTFVPHHLTVTHGDIITYYNNDSSDRHVRALAAVRHACPWQWKRNLHWVAALSVYFPFPVGLLVLMSHLFLVSIS